MRQHVFDTECLQLYGLVFDGILKNDFSTAIGYHITNLEVKTGGRAEVINI